jgi:hypothetical protein
MGFVYYAPPAASGGVEVEVDPTALKKANDLSDLDDAPTARGNLGLGDLAVGDDATDVPYTPDVAGNWYLGVPADTAAALDYLAVVGKVLDPTDAEEGDVLSLSGGNFGWAAPSGASIANTGSYHFDGSDDSMSIANAASPNLSLTGDFTIEAWVYIPSVSGDRTICSRWQEASAASKNHTFRTDGNQRLELLLWDSVGGFQVVYTSDILDLEGQGWVHVAVTFDVATDTAVFYLNGVAVTSDTSAIDTIQAGTADFVVGAEEGGADYFEGLINLLRVWGDVRTQSEISGNMYSIIGAAGDDLIAEWSMNGDATDSISGYDLVVSGATSTSFVPWRV